MYEWMIQCTESMKIKCLVSRSELCNSLFRSIGTPREAYLRFYWSGLLFFRISPNHNFYYVSCRPFQKNLFTAVLYSLKSIFPADRHLLFFATSRLSGNFLKVYGPCLQPIGISFLKIWPPECFNRQYVLNNYIICIQFRSLRAWISELYNIVVGQYIERINELVELYKQDW